MRRYLYLAKREWAETWVQGGQIPISLASTYKAVERIGVFTPDENLIHISPVDVSGLRRFGLNFQNVRGLTFKGNRFNGELLPDFENADYYNEDGLILSFSNVISSEIMTRLEKVACVAILDIQRMKELFDKQIGVPGIAKDCEYTLDHQRNHFLKSQQDAWQQEYRIFWASNTPISVHMPLGLATHVDLP